MDATIAQATLLQELSMRRHEHVERAFTLQITRAATVFAFSNFIVMPAVTALMKLSTGGLRFLALAAIAIPYATMVGYCWKAYTIGALESLPNPARLISEIATVDVVAARLSIIADIEAAITNNLASAARKSRYMTCALRALLAEIIAVILVISCAVLSSKPDITSPTLHRSATSRYDMNDKYQPDEQSKTVESDITSQNNDIAPVDNRSREEPPGLPRTLPKAPDMRDLVPATPRRQKNE